MNGIICRWYFWQAKFPEGKLYCVWDTLRYCLWGCIPCGICSAPWLVRCTIQVLRVVAMMFYLLAYCGFILLSSKGLAVCGCSKILQIYVCKLIGWILYYRSRLRLIVACCSNMYHNWSWKFSYTLHSNAMKWFLNVWIDLSTLLALWLLGGTNWQLISMVVITIFNAVDALLSMKWNHVFIPRLFKSVVNHRKYLIISLSLLFFVTVFIISL